VAIYDVSSIKHIIAWTGRGRGRFKLINPVEVHVSSIDLKFSIAEMACLFMTIYGEIFKIKNKKIKL